MGEWQMYDQQRLHAIEEEEENSFKALPEDIQKLLTQKYGGSTKIDEAEEESHPTEGKSEEAAAPDAEKCEGELPNLLSEETQKEKEMLLQEGFSSWSRFDYTSFVKACAKFGRNSFPKIAADVGKSEDDIKIYAAAFWGDQGRQRISEVSFPGFISVLDDLIIHCAYDEV
jgi:SWI/SNF-related matrix-associated actin-dependent regulator of chromatin subfamily A member 5